MKRSLRWTAGSLCALAFAVSAQADSITVTGNVFSAGTTPGTGGGEFVATLDGTTTLNVYCIDFSDYFSFNQAYNTIISTPPSLSNTRLGSNIVWEYNLGGTYDATSRYLMAAHLTTQYATAGSSTVTNGIQDAIWAMLDVNTNLNLPSNTAALTEITAAKTWYSGISANPSALTGFESQVRFYTDAGGNNGTLQEFVSVAPEPSSLLMLLLGTALVCGGMYRKSAKTNRR